MRRLLRTHTLSPELAAKAAAEALTKEDFEGALGRVNSSVSKRDVERYVAWGREYGAFVREERV
jgi:hypothetical protein